MGVVTLRLPRGHSARNPREGSDGIEFAITVQWVPAWSLGSAGVPDELSPALSCGALGVRRVTPSGMIALGTPRMVWTFGGPDEHIKLCLQSRPSPGVHKQ